MPSYLQAGLQLDGLNPGPPAIVRELQTDLRALGYLGGHIDGVFGQNTLRAVRALCWDLQYNFGRSNGSDGRAPVAIMDYNRGRVGPQAGIFDQNIAGCLADLISDHQVSKLPRSATPAADNVAALKAVDLFASRIAPSPFILAMAVQESDSRHYCVPSGEDSDDFVSIGLDRNDGNNPDRITSRGYGLGQYTIYHHPPRPEEITEFILDPVGNVKTAFSELRSKFDRFVVGPDGTAADRTAEHPLLALRLCKFPMTDPRYLADCRRCANSVPAVDIVRGTPCFRGASMSYQPDPLYPSASYPGVPDRAAFACDWPYAARRYNGDGLMSYHYQARILRNLRRQKPAGAAP